MSDRYGMARIPELTSNEPVETPYVKARQVWDERVGQARVQAFNWRVACFVSMAITLLSVAGLIYQSSKSSVVPYLVEVEASGKVRLVGKVQEQDWSLTESSKKVELERWVQHLRGISSDRMVMTERLASVRTSATAAANLQLDRLFERQNPFSRFGDEVRVAHIEAMTQLPGATQAYRVEWREEIWDKDGVAQLPERFVGEFHLSIVPPKDEAMLKVNPLGVYVAFFDFSAKR